MTTVPFKQKPYLCDNTVVDFLRHVAISSPQHNQSEPTAMPTPAGIDLVYKITSAQAWADAVSRGTFTGSPDDLRDGYIHLSAAHQVVATAEKYYVNVPNLLLVAVAPSALGAALKWELSRGGDLFPHLYGDLPTESVQWVRQLPLAVDGLPCIAQTLNGEHSSHD
jgi:uncharacterized protein (DUF952 family)